MPIYMKFPGVKGTGKGKYEGWIELQSAGLGVTGLVNSPSGRGTNREAAAPSGREIVVMKYTDTASPDLARLSQSGQAVKVTIDFIAENCNPPAPYRSLELQGTLISAYSARASDKGAGAKVLESLSLNFSAMTVANTAGKTASDPKQHPDRAMWDLAAERGS